MNLPPETVCSYCKADSDVFVTFENGLTICLPCRQREVARIEASDAAYAAAGFGEMQSLEQWHADGNR